MSWHIDHPPSADDPEFTSQFVASEFTPTGSIQATDTVSAIAEVASDAASLQTIPPSDITPTAYLGVPGVLPIGAVGSGVLSANTLWYFPMVVDNQNGITLTSGSAEITVAGTASSTVRLLIASADAAWSPMALVADEGTKPNDATGVITWSLSRSLPRGRYLVALYPTANATFRFWKTAPGGVAWLSPSLGSSAYVAYLARGTGSPTSVPNYNTVGTSSSPGMLTYVGFRWTVNP